MSLSRSEITHVAGYWQGHLLTADKTKTQGWELLPLPLLQEADLHAQPYSGSVCTGVTGTYEDFVL